MSSQTSQQQNILRFTLQGRGYFGINVLKIREIVPYKHLSRLPGSDPCVAGLIELRGHNIQVIDLSKAIGQSSMPLGPDHESSIIVTEFNRTMQGLLVKHVDKIANIDWNDVRELPRATGVSHYLSGVINLDNELVGLLDVEKVLYELQPQASRDQSEVPIKNIPGIENKRILAVDDSRVARSMLAKTLDGIGVDYIMASSGQDALDITNESGINIDMIISDIEMPQMDGYSLTRQLRQQESTKGCYILLHSSLSGNACETMSKEVGANALLTKFASNEIIDRISEALQAS